MPTLLKQKNPQTTTYYMHFLCIFILNKHSIWLSQQGRRVCRTVKTEITRTLYTNIFVALKAITWLFTSVPLTRQLLINIPFSNQNNLQNINNRQEYAYYIAILFAFNFVHYIFLNSRGAQGGSLISNSLFYNQI